MKPINPLIVEEIRLGLFDPAVRVTARGSAYGNPLVMGALEGTGPATGYLVYDERSATTLALIWVKRGTPGAKAVRRRGEERTGVWSFGPVLARHPRLKVEKGYVRRFPFRVEDGLFLIDLNVEEVVPSKRRG